MISFAGLEVWFVTGSQHLYGPETLQQVQEHSQEIVRGLSEAGEIPVRVVLKPVMTSSEALYELALEANSQEKCIGLITWMHTFSPAKLWIAALKTLRKPFAHLHTQFNRDLPWASIDMDFMNLNQSAHGDREFGFIASRMRLGRKVIVGFWQDAEVMKELATWTRAACAWHDAQRMKVARFGDNMRNVAVTEGDKVDAQIRLGYSVQAFGVGDLAQQVRQVTDAEIDRLAAEYDACYQVAESLRVGGSQRQALREAARIEIGLRQFLEAGGFTAFTDNFEDLHGLEQLPGVAVQRLMADGYGFGGEGDWKTAALVRSMKVMSAGLPAGTSFMEDYTYHLRDGGQVLGAHMLEICPSIAGDGPSLQIHPLSIGGKADPVRLVFTAPPGPAVCASAVDMGDRFRMIVNQVDVVAPEQPLPKLPVARALWIPRPSLKVAATTWILAGGAHHTGFSQALTAQHLQDFAEIAGMEFLLIDENTSVREFQKELKWNDAYYRMARC
ncbi:MAG: L-arabinose isomerase [Acidobacteriaceae bacterium]|nr:L-arabinose isomerase [Acidobacteriaceae bacterium]MBV9225615.1 L-arabinose isomerase [Acidobacteriaceae bacterium]